MYLIDTGTTDPYFNIAAEEFFFRGHEEELVILYINSPSIIVGKHQNAYEEINYSYVRTNGLPVIRRISGGGTVYHDGGNLNFTFMAGSDQGRQVNFARFIKPVNDFLRLYGVDPEVGVKNEVRAGGLKFSGNAEHVFRNRVLHHGTLLFSSKLDNLGAALKRGNARFESRSVASNRTDVGNLDALMPAISSIEMLKDKLSDFLVNLYPGSSYKQIDSSERVKISSLADEKYRSWEWNFGYGPSYSITNTFASGAITFNIRLWVEKGIIIRGEISSPNGILPLSDKLAGIYHRYEDLRKFFNGQNFSIDNENLYRFFG